MSLRFIGYLSLSTISGFILFTAAMLAWWVSDRALPVLVLRTEVMTPLVRPRSFLYVRQDVRYVRDCRAHVDRVVYDSHTNRDFPPDIDYERPPQGVGTHTITFKVWIPDDFRPGPAYYRAAPQYACNPLQRYYWPITRPDTVIEFEIAARLPDARRGADPEPPE